MGALDLRATLVRGYDWEGVYINRKLVKQGHSVSLEDFCTSAGIDLDILEVDQEYLEDQGGYLPDSLDEVRWE